MSGTTIAIEGRDFLINSRLTYEGRHHQGRRIEGLLMNSRMIQAIFDDENPGTVDLWRYPDTGKWDPDRNTAEFCAALPLYRAHGLLGVTVGLQGGGPIYTKGIYDRYICSAFRPDGTLKQPYRERLARILEAADACGMVVIVSYFYWRQERFLSDDAVLRAARLATEWLLATGHRNILLDVKNEIKEGPGILESGGMHKVLDVIRQTTLEGRRLWVGTSTFPDNAFPQGKWHEYCDYLMPHGNDSQPDQLRQELRQIKEAEAARGKVRPILINEDSPDIENLEAAVDEGVSWGYYDQGYGCDYKHLKIDWTVRPRESRVEDLSGYQTPPVNWGINTPEKRAFFGRVAEITGATPPAHGL
jgi:hypothetical protein